MDKDILMILLITSLIWMAIAIAVYVVFSRKSDRAQLKFNSELRASNRAFSERLEKILNDKNEALRNSYEAGFKDATEKNVFSIQILP